MGGLGGGATKEDRQRKATKTENEKREKRRAPRVQKELDRQFQDMRQRRMNRGKKGAV